jgi:subtilisin family serine protease
MNAIPPRNTPNRPTHLSGIRTLAANVAVPLLFGLGTAATALAAPPSADRYIIKFQPGLAAQARAAVAAARGNVVLEMPDHDAVAVELPAAALAGIERNPNVEYIEPDVLRFPMALASPSTGTPYALGQLVPFGIPMIQADQLAAADAGSRKVCIIDSGYDLGHPDLASSLDVTGEFDSGTGWWYTDENHHGTHVAGTISAINNGLGVVGVVSNQKLKLHIVKVFDAAGWAYSSTLTNAVTKCVNAGANVISMSLGGSFSSRTEKSAFDKYYAAPYQVLSIAAAGNGGNNRVSYPAGYGSVVSVAAVDENRAWATFSQYNKDVEIAAPGVGVLSTVPRGAGRDSSLSVGGTAYASSPMDGSPVGSANSAALVDCGLGTATCAGANGKVCLIQRGTNTFGEKVLACQNGGGVGAVIYNNTAGMLFGTLGTTVTAIPSVGTSDTDGAALKLMIGAVTDLAVVASDHAYFDGTSMATPHVSAAAALVWSKNTACTAAQVRAALTGTALDLGTAGRDNKFGFGLLQAKNAYDALKTTATCN